VLCASDNEQYSSALASTEDEEHYDQVSQSLQLHSASLNLQLMVVLRNTDAKQGKSLGYVYHGMLTLGAIYSTAIMDLDENVREKIHAIFRAITVGGG
jgi:hypothetical protein